jgi:DNA-binding transcriptional ArsR family regulator
MGTNPRLAEVILHPQRMAILRILARGPLTTKQIAEALAEVPQATLYRHVALLHEAEVISVTAERPVRGTTERTYALGSKLVLSAEDLANATRDDHFRYFATFVAGLLSEYGTYLDRPAIDPEADGVGYREHVLHLSRPELTEMLAELREVLQRRLSNDPNPKRFPLLFSTISIPLDRPQEGNR